MNFQDYVPILGTYRQIEYQLSDEASEEPLGNRLFEAVVNGAISGTIFGGTVLLFPGPGSVYAARAMATGLQAVPSLGVLAAPAVLAAANYAVIEAAPEEQQRGLWQMFSSALAGVSWGGDYSKLI